MFSKLEGLPYDFPHCIPLEGHTGGEFSTFFLFKGHAIRHFIKFSPLEKHP